MFLVFVQTASHDFVHFDDAGYVYENRHVNRGLSAAGIAWALTTNHAANWHPMTWLSHELDCQIYGLWSGGHHLTNVLLHAAAAVLLFLALRRMTAAPWLSAWVAAMFAIHPLRVESVAWAAERKDVLSGLFFMLTLWFYARYTERPASWGRYALVVSSFALGLMAKPMLVTLPFVLLLLDYWPLGRMGVGEKGRKGEREKGSGGEREQEFQVSNLKSRTFLALFVEKTPLFILAAGSCLVTLAAQHDAMQSLEQRAVPWRIANAAVAYAAYLGQMLYPVGLSIFYPLFKGPPPAWKVVAAITLLSAISAAAVLTRRKCPYLLFGWLWYLGTLLPVIGLVQVGDQAMADRYTYLTQIGLYMALAWGAADLSRTEFIPLPFLFNAKRNEFRATKRSSRRRLLPAVAALVLAGWIASAWQQTRYWRNSETLWTHALTCNPQNPVAYNNLALALTDWGRVDEAIASYRSALKIAPDYELAYYNLGLTLAGRGETDEAIAQYRKALEIKPDADAYINLGMLLAGRRQFDEAIAHYRKALEIRPDDADAHNDLGLALAGRGAVDEAIAQYRKALEIEPADVHAHINLGNVFADRGQLDEAIAQYREALEIEPDDAHAHYDLGRVFAGRGQLEEAIDQYRKTLEIRPDDPDAHNSLGLALAGCGQFEEAVAQYRKAVEIKPADPHAYINLGNLFAGRGQTAEAIALYVKAVEINPGNAQAHYNLGNVLAGRGQAEEAIVQYRKALEIKPDYVDVHANLANVLAAHGQVDEAIAQYRMALEIDPNDAETHWNLGIALSRPRKGRRGRRPVPEGPGPRLRPEGPAPGRLFRARLRAHSAVAPAAGTP